MTHILSKLQVFLYTAVLFAGASYLSAQWQGPTATPPANNAPAPISVGSVFQERSGDLSLTGATGLFGGLIFQDGNEAEGRVLVSDAQGVARWEDPSVIGGNNNRLYFGPEEIIAEVPFQNQVANGPTFDFSTAGILRVLFISSNRTFCSETRAAVYIEDVDGNITQPFHMSILSPDGYLVYIAEGEKLVGVFTASGCRASLRWIPVLKTNL